MIAAIYARWTTRIVVAMLCLLALATSASAESSLDLVNAHDPLLYRLSRALMEAAIQHHAAEWSLGSQQDSQQDRAVQEFVVTCFDDRLRPSKTSECSLRESTGPLALFADVLRQAH